VPPHFYGYPVLGVVGLLFGLFMCLRLFFSIGKHGGL
jgi:hypothetical protein